MFNLFSIFKYANFIKTSSNENLFDHSYLSNMKNAAISLVKRSHVTISKTYKLAKIWEAIGALSQLTTTFYPINIKNLILLIKSNHQFPNVVMETSSSLDTTIIIYYCNTNISHKKTVTSICCYDNDYPDGQQLHHEKHGKSKKTQRTLSWKNPSGPHC